MSIITVIWIPGAWEYIWWLDRGSRPSLCTAGVSLLLYQCRGPLCPPGANWALASSVGRNLPSGTLHICFVFIINWPYQQLCILESKYIILVRFLELVMPLQCWKLFAQLNMYLLSAVLQCFQLRVLLWRMIKLVEFSLWGWYGFPFLDIILFLYVSFVIKCFQERLNHLEHSH